MIGKVKAFKMKINDTTLIKLRVTYSSFYNGHWEKNLNLEIINNKPVFGSKIDTRCEKFCKKNLHPGSNVDVGASL